MDQDGIGRWNLGTEERKFEGEGEESAEARFLGDGRGEKMGFREKEGGRVRGRVRV